MTRLQDNQHNHSMCQVDLIYSNDFLCLLKGAAFSKKLEWRVPTIGNISFGRVQKIPEEASIGTLNHQRYSSLG